MRITFVLPSVSITGGNRVVFEYANALTDRGHEISIVFPLFFPQLVTGHNLRHPLAFLLRTANTARDRYLSRWFDIRADLCMVPTGSPLAAGLSRHLVPDADIIVATSWETTYFVDRLGPGKGKKYYLVQHYEIWDVWDDEDCWREAVRIGGRGAGPCRAMKDVVPAKARLKRAKELVDRTYRMPFRKITISAWLRELLETGFGEPVDGMIVNGVNFDTFRREGGNGRDRRGTVNVLMPYRPDRWKGMADGLAAFRIVRDRHPEVCFHMFGFVSGPEIPGWVRFHRNPSDDELRKIYCMSDIFVLPSWVEGCQLPPMEAMACGCAVVATGVGGVQDYAVDGKTILTAPPRDPEALARHIISLIEDPQERERIAGNGHDHIRQFTWKKAADQMETIFLKAMKTEHDSIK